MKKLRFKNERGITLIALVITIIVLLILAGVSINLVIGENGILNKAQQAAKQTELATIKEKINMEIMALQADNAGELISSSEVIEHLMKIGMVAEDGKTLAENSNYTISPNGNITVNGKKVDNVEISSLSKTCVVEAEVMNEELIQYFNGKSKVNIICHNGEIELYELDGKKMHKISVTNIPKGKKFAYWLDQDSNIISYKQSEEFFNALDMEYTPVFIEEEEIVQKECTISLNGFRFKNLEEIGKQKCLFCLISVPCNGYEIVNMGLIRTISDFSTELILENCNDNDIKDIYVDSITEENPLKSGSYTYMFRAKLSVASAPKTYRARGFIKYRNIETGEIFTKYTNTFEYESVK